MDRFARSVSQASDLITQLIDSGVTVNILNLGILSNDSVSTLMKNVLLSFAQFERDMIVQRTSEGKAIARQDPNYREGRKPTFSREQRENAIDLCKTHTVSQVCKMTGMSRATIFRLKRTER